MLVMILPTSASYKSISASSWSLKVSLFSGTFLITLYNVAKLPLGFVEAVTDKRVIWKPGKIINSGAEMRVRNPDVNRAEDGQDSSHDRDCGDS